MKYPILLFFLSALTFAQAQEYLDPNAEPCGIDYISQSNTLSIASGVQRTQLTPYIIPVVVHVFYDMNSPGQENISEAQIHSGIAAMNAQYSGAEGGTSADIEFRLAKKDPNGDCTNGIVRVPVDKPFVSIDGDTDLCAYSRLDLCNLSRWDSPNYMNIWVVKGIGTESTASCAAYLSSGIRGVSSAPGSSPLKDGITVKYSFF